MKVSDYIVEYLIEKGITDVFGYPGGMITHLMESFSKYHRKISAHVTYHEQGAAFAACGYAQAKDKPGVAYATSGRMGPVLLDIPMNIFKMEIDPNILQGGILQNTYVSMQNVNVGVEVLERTLAKALRPCCLIGNGVKITNAQNIVKSFCDRFNIPMVTSMIAFDVVNNDPHNYGFIGAYGDRAANFVVAKSDLVITIGSRMDVRQVGAKRENFAPNSQIVRFDVDQGELAYHVHDDEITVHANMQEVILILNCLVNKCKFDFNNWILNCDEIKKELAGVDKCTMGEVVRKISNNFPEDAVITTDVGQNQVWIAQSMELKKGQKVLFSGGHGAMGYSLPAAIGAYYASRKSVVCVTGDGGLQMNIQELQFIVREKLPIKIVVFNNNALGMIRHFQEMYFNGNYYQTKPSGGYDAPNFSQIAAAYGIRSICWNLDNLPLDPVLEFYDDLPLLVEIRIKEDTYIFPKLKFGKPNQDQEPLLDRELYNRLMKLGS